ncbi:MAG: glycosyltransferase, partial [Stellaceae bacterium]
MQPLVTVLIPAYNAEGTIRRALDSALAQDYPNFEIVVVDDGSLDATSDVVAGYQRPEIRLVQLPKHLGECGAMNEGIAIAAGKYIAFLDADHEWLPGKLTRQVAALEGNPKAVMATCGCRFVDPNGELAEEFGMMPPGVTKDQVWRSLLVATCIAKPFVVARASAFAHAGVFDTAQRVAGDQEMWIRLAITGEVEFVPEFLTVAHDTAGSLTKVYREDEDIYSLRVVRRYLQQQRSHLSGDEIRHILRERYTSMGRNVYRAGRIWRGGLLLAQAIALGGHKGENLWYLLTASPPARIVKALLRPKTDATPSKQTL